MKDFVTLFRVASVGAGVYGWTQAHKAWKATPKLLRGTPVGKAVNSGRIAFGVIAVAGMLTLIFNRR